MATQQTALAEYSTEELSISLAEMLNLLAALDEPEESDAAAVLSDEVRDTVRQAISDKLKRYQGFFSFCAAQSAQCDAELDRLRARKKAIDGAKDRLRHYLARAMDAHGIKRLDAGTVVFTLRAGGQSLQITNEELIPYQFKEEKIVVDIDKPALKRAILAGDAIEGAEVVVGDPVLLVR